MHKQSVFIFVSYTDFFLPVSIKKSLDRDVIFFWHHNFICVYSKLSYQKFQVHV